MMTTTPPAIDERTVTVTPIGAVVSLHRRLERALTELTRIERAELATLLADVHIAE